MCDFAADAEAARQLLVGRVLTVERVCQLNAKDYFYQMLKDNPGMLKIYPGIENKLLLDEMLELADLGVYVGTYCQPMIPSLCQPVADLMETINTIKAIGPQRCIIGSDFGQVLHMDSIDGMRVFIRALLAFGIKEHEVRVMLHDNPAKLMWLD